MELQSLNISKNPHGFEYDGLRPGEVGGSIKFSSGAGEVKVRLQPQHITAILAIVADNMVVTTRELAASLTRDVIEHAGLALPMPAEPVAVDNDDDFELPF